MDGVGGETGRPGGGWEVIGVGRVKWGGHRIFELSTPWGVINSHIADAQAPLGAQRCGAQVGGGATKNNMEGVLLDTGSGIARRLHHLHDPLKLPPRSPGRGQLVDGIGKPIVPETPDIEVGQQQEVDFPVANSS